MWNKKNKSLPEPGRDDISEYITSVHFRKKLFGVSEEDLWAVVSNIQKYYEAKAEKDAAVIEELEKQFYAGRS